MTSKYQLHVYAKHDYQAAADWYEKQRDGLADEFVDAVEETVDRICRTPSSFGFYRGTTMQFCKVQQFPFVVIYDVEGALVLIISIHHTSRDDKYLEKRRDFK